jgi:hypothetical protein
MGLYDTGKELNVSGKVEIESPDDRILFTLLAEEKLNPDFPLENFQGLKTGTNLTGKSKFFDWFHMPSNHSR